MYTLYTDGGYSIKHNVGASAFVLLRDNDIATKGGHKLTNATNNIAELEAILTGLMSLPDKEAVTVKTDSQYCIGVLTKWNPTKNLELINTIKDYIAKHELNVTFEWVRGHSGDPYNELCDSMCNAIAGIDLNAEVQQYIRYKKRK